MSAVLYWRMIVINKIKVAIIGYGNIGQHALDAVQAAPDMQLMGIVRRQAAVKEAALSEIKVVEDIAELGKVDVAIVCTPTRNVEQTAQKYLAMGINTIDSFDIHTAIVDLRKSLAVTAKDNKAVAIIAAGWDPGSDSVVRALLEACAPNGITYTNFGPGMSMGHSVVARSIDGVKDALSLTIPMGTGVHRRMVYVELEEGAVFEKVVADLKADDYFSHDDTHVIAVDDIAKLMDMGHGVNIMRKGVSGSTHNQLFEYNMKINNPALTAQIMVSAARASMKQQPGAYTMIELPLVDLLPGDREALIAKLV